MDKPLSRTEIKILVYNKVKRGVPYKDAVKQVNEEIETINELEKKKRRRKKDG